MENRDLNCPIVVLAEKKRTNKWLAEEEVSHCHICHIWHFTIMTLRRIQTIFLFETITKKSGSIC